MNRLDLLELLTSQPSSSSSSYSSSTSHVPHPTGVELCLHDIARDRPALPVPLARAVRVHDVLAGLERPR